jgi:hypothetical protein
MIRSRSEGERMLALETSMPLLPRGAA